MEDENESLTCANDVTSIIAQICDYKSECTVQSSNTLAGDLCLGTHKYLSASYHSGKTPCNGKEVGIEDSSEETVDKERSHCCDSAFNSAESSSSSSSSSSEEDKESNRCKYKTTCYIRVNNATMGGDPCPGTYKYLSVTAQCV
ncbi:L-rhamnose-binding lectin CSL3-like [Anabas testudineus]|uniref:L-rhamnose-binding lectin CSL3-like n=1 Tax=Anabas testudineus TaxID=64144 RepID=UPI000E45EFFA|nr:L-rhamnose-binding lectin CSL3-like [Anabas testudineus]